MANNYDSYSKQELVQLLNKRDYERKLGLVWERDDIEHERTINNDFVTLELDQELSVGEAPYRNLLIEGDNFDALRHLNIAYKGKVKCIYIDPPYNRGKRDFIYNDHYIDKDHAYRHSLWLEFMFQRLQQAKDLLTQDGMIFVSICDKEFFRLCLLLEQVFGEENKIGVIVWKNATDNNPTRIAVEHEYIVCFARDLSIVPAEWKSAESDVKRLLLEKEAELLEAYECEKELQAEYTKWFRNHKKGLWPLDRYKFIDKQGVFTGSQSVHNPGKEGYRYDVIHPDTGLPCKQPLMGYRFPQESIEKLITEDRVLYGKDENKIIELKVYAKDYRQKLPSVISLDGRAGANELRKIFPEVNRAFNNPKPTALLEELLSFVTSGDDIVLDFFAGSGSTGHAVLNLNNSDSGNRRFILVSSRESTEEEPDKNICSDVCAVRMKRVIEGFNGLPVLGGTMAYMRSIRTPMEDLYDDIRHDQIWYTLQQIHFDGISPCQEDGEIQVLESEDLRLAYLSETTSATLARLNEFLDKDHKQTVIYSWQPGVVEQHCLHEHLQIQRIPEYLTDRFGGGAA